MRDLLKSGCVTRIRPLGGVKIIALNGHLLKDPIHIAVSRASPDAMARIEELGGTVTTVYFNRLSLRAHLKPAKFDVLPYPARPVKWRDIKYYTNDENRGYLSQRAFGADGTGKRPNRPHIDVPEDTPEKLYGKNIFSRI